MDIPPPPPPPPSPEDTPPQQPPHDAPPSSYAAPPPYAKQPYEQQGTPPYAGPGQPSYPGQDRPPQGGRPYGAPGPYNPPPQQPGGTGNPYAGGPYGSGPAGGNPYAQRPYPGHPGNPGPAGPPGYPGGWYPPPPTNTNGMAIASLVTSFTCIPLLGAIFGLVGLKQIKRRGERGKGLAVAGLVLSTIGTLGLALIITLGVLGVLDDGNTRVDRLEVGQCFNTVDSSLGDYRGDGERSTTVDVVKCAEKHDAEAFAIFGVEPGSGGGYPGVDAISAIAESKCASLADEYAAGVPWENSVDIYYYMPPPDGWRRGDHSVTCFFGATDGKVTGSVKDGGPSKGFGV
ncbi:DUF4190 domain-containing protein [Actinacidiphila alni]|uniref:DUF4190 domain-containing protein n=1 Tax=Actinacidiphila alni TaxID=380248 RepID=UPI0033D0E3C3